ncbi:MAG: hypothetical protein IJW17_00835 [Lentisphaeria bacterium]|nr:hypothetical protein [Lentisphaeria bacterium]
MANDFTNICDNCILSKKHFCLGNQCDNFYDEMWKHYKNDFPDCASILCKTVEGKNKSRLQIKAENRKRLDGANCPAKCYFAVLLYQTIHFNGLDPYSGLEIEWENCDKGGKYNKAPAIDHIDPNRKAPFTKENKELNLVFCRNDVNDAKNNLLTEEFVNLCESVLKHHGYTVSAPSGVYGLSQEN